MNKIAIPALLVATVMVAGAFAFMPVEQASTVHTSTAGQGLVNYTVVDADGFDAGDAYTLDCTTDYLLHSVSAFATAGTVADETVEVDIGGNAYGNAVAIGGAETAAVFILSTAISVPLADDLVITFSAGSDDGNEVWEFVASLQTAGTCTFTETT